MAEYQLSNLVTYVRDLINEDVADFHSDAEIKRYINDGEREVAIGGMCVQNIDTAATATHSGTLAFVTSALVTAGSADDIELRSATWSGYALSYVEENYVGLWRMLSQIEGHLPLGTRPTSWHTHGVNVYIEPLPDAVYSTQQYVVDAPSAEMSADANTPTVPMGFCNLIITYAVAQCLKKEGRLAAFQLLMAMFGAELAYLKASLIDIVPDTKSRTNEYLWEKANG